MSKFISVIIPCYNSEQFINNCLNCLTKQTSNDFEVIFVDDGSTDNTLKILNESSFENKKVISTTHQGPAEARNVALEQAGGKYIWFIDSDDVIEYNAIEKIINCLKQSNADILRMGLNINKDNEITLCESPYNPGIYEGKQLFVMQRYAVGYAHAKPFFITIQVYRKELFKDVSLLSLWEYLSESNSLNQRMYPRAKKLQVIDDVLYQYNIRPGSASFVHRPLLDKTINLYKALKTDFKSIGIYEKYKDMIAMSIVDSLMLHFCIPNTGAFITEYSYCSSIDVAHKRVQEIMNSNEFDELIKEASQLKADPLMEKAHKILLNKNEKELFEFLKTFNPYLQ